MNTPLNTIRPTRSSDNHGFTLVEIMVTLAILLIMAVIAIPRVTTALPTMRIKASTRELFSNLQKAKVEAARNNTNVVITFSDGDGGSYTFFIDENDNHTQDSSEPVVADVTLPSNISISSSFSAGLNGFSALGLPIENHWGSVTLSPTNSNAGIKQFKVSLSYAGCIRIYSSTDGTTWK